MNRKVVLTVSLATILLSPVFGRLFITPTSASTTLHVYPGQSILQAINFAQLGDTIFVHEGTYYEHVVVNKTVSLIGEDMDNTIIDGGESGIVLCITTNNVAISNFTIAKGHSDLCGIYVNSSNNRIEKNIITENNFGIQFYESYNNTVSSNRIINNSYGIYMKHSDHNVFEGNNITSNRYGGAYMWQSSHNLFSRNMITKNWVGTGIFGNDCSFSILNENVLMENFCGIDICDSRHVQCIGNTIFNNTHFGIRMEDYADYTSIIKNNITGHVHGVWTHVSRFNLFIKNVVARNVNGFSFHGSGGPTGGTLKNILNYNDIINNTVGVHVWYADSSLFSRNNFVNNTVHVYSEGSINYWDEGYISCGNYWNNYTGVDLYSGPYQNETGSDGIGDAPYVLNKWNRDHYPLMGMFSHFNATSEHHVNIISNSTISRFHFDQANKKISFDITGEDGKIGFCRAMIPTELMNYSYIVLVDGEEIIPILLDISNKTHAYLYFKYIHSTQTVTIVSSKLLYLHYQLLDDYTNLLKDFNSLNSTYRELLNNYGTLNASYQQHLSDYSALQGSYTSLQSNFNSLQDQYNSLNSTLTSEQEALISELNTIRNLMYVFMATTVMFIIATVYLAIGKPKIKT